MQYPREKNNINNMVTIILSLSSVGMALIITRSFLFEHIRDLMAEVGEYAGTLFSCPQCMGFWCGVLLSFVSFSWFNLLTVPFISSLIGYLISLIDE